VLAARTRNAAAASSARALRAGEAVPQELTPHRGGPRLMCPWPSAPRSGCGGQKPPSSMRCASAYSGSCSSSHTDAGIAWCSTATPCCAMLSRTCSTLSGSRAPTAHSSGRKGRGSMRDAPRVCDAVACRQPRRTAATTTRSTTQDTHRHRQERGKGKELLDSLAHHAMSPLSQFVVLHWSRLALGLSCPIARRGHPGPPSQPPSRS
jgi:hypothetical protein